MYLIFKLKFIDFYNEPIVTSNKYQLADYESDVSLRLPDALYNLSSSSALQHYYCRKVLASTTLHCYTCRCHKLSPTWRERRLTLNHMAARVPFFLVLCLPHLLLLRPSRSSISSPIPEVVSGHPSSVLRTRWGEPPANAPHLPQTVSPRFSHVSVGR